jgi:hypothetical protein
MKFADHLSKKDIQKFNSLRRAAENKKEHRTKKPKEDERPAKQKKKDEKVNWVDIMGMNRDIYTRKNGAVRRK